MNEIVQNKTKRDYMLEELRFDEGTLQHKEEGNFDINISGSKSETVLAGAAAKIATAEEEAVDSVRVLACCGVVETAEESVAAAGVSGQRREEKVEVGLRSPVPAESCCIWAIMSEVFWVSCSCESEKNAYKRQKPKENE